MLKLIETLKNLIHGSLARRIYSCLRRKGYYTVAQKVQDGSFVYLGHLYKEGTIVSVTRDSLNKATLYFEFEDPLPGEEEDTEYTMTVESLKQVEKIR